MRHVCDPTACHHTEAAVFAARVCFGWRAGWLVTVAVNQSLPDGQEANLSPVCRYASTSQIAADPAAPLIPAWPQQRHTGPHRPRVHSAASLGGLLEAREEHRHTCWT